jgi:Zn-dependent protease
MDITGETLALGLMWYAAFLFSTTFHEAAHAWAALRLGDPTAYHGGQVTLNPIPHIVREPFGTVLVPLLSFFLGGWMMGWASAPYDPFWADRYPKRAALMALAGPLSNLAIAILAAVALRWGLTTGALVPPESLSFSQLVAAADPGSAWGPLSQLLSILFALNLLLFTFNLLPLPPLDGSALPPLVLGDSAGRSYLEFMREPMWTMVGILVAWKLIGFIFSPVLTFALGLLYA